MHLKLKPIISIISSHTFSGAILAILMILMIHSELFDYRNAIALIGFIVFLSVSIVKLKASIRTLYLPIVAYLLFSVMMVMTSHEPKEILGAAFSLLLLLVVIMRKDHHMVLFQFLISINVINFVGWILSLMALMFHEFGNILTDYGVIHYDTVINLFGYEFYRFQGFLWQSSLVASYVILPAILLILVLGDNGKKTLIPYANILLALVSISGGYISLIVLALTLYLFIGIFRANYYLYFLTIVTLSLIIIFSNNFLEGFQIDSYDNLEYINNRIDSARSRLSIIKGQLQILIEQGLMFGGNYDSTGFFGNHFLTHMKYMGYIGLIYSLWLAFALSRFLVLAQFNDFILSKFIYSMLLAYFLQMFVYYDFGFSGYFGLIVVLIVFNFARICSFAHSLESPQSENIRQHEV